VQYMIVIILGITIVFIIPRLTPIDPVQMTLQRMTAVAQQYMEPEELLRMKEDLIDLYGLRGSLFEQYLNFWKQLLRGNLGPSLANFPTPVVEIIATSLPWTATLLAVSTLLGWIIGNILGGIAGYFSEKKWAQGLSTIAMCIYPIPYYIMALTLVVLLCYVFSIFPLMGGHGIGLQPSFSWEFISSALTHSFLPAFSLIIIGIGRNFLFMRAITSTVVASDYVTYAEAAGVPQRKVLFQYVIRNSLLPQVTYLAMSLGGIFGGALVTEYVFSYPGLGRVLQIAILNGDFNLMMGIVFFSIIGVTTGALIIDLLYPLFDPRIRYK
ncbi:MAG: ABC transporter permease, partial [Synergistetes bacterium]|nr:ABC transporter permease [Synergistota bacterium]